MEPIRISIDDIQSIQLMDGHYDDTKRLRTVTYDAFSPSFETLLEKLFVKRQASRAAIEEIVTETLNLPKGYFRCSDSECPTDTGTFGVAQLANAIHLFEGLTVADFPPDGFQIETDPIMAKCLSRYHKYRLDQLAFIGDLLHSI